MIDVVDMTKTFGAKPVLDRVALTLAPGERAALIGHNGSGKTTLMRCLLGLYEFEGQIRIGGRCPRGERKAALANVGFVPQTAPALRMAVEDFIAATCDLTGCDAQTVAAGAAELGLDVAAVRRRPFRLLSGGMKHKLLIAAALARRPRVLLLDEPAASLDPSARGIFFSMLAKLPPETVIIVSSHRVDELAGIVTRLIELDAGRIVLDDMVASGTHDTLGRRFACRLRLRAPNLTVAAGLREWSFAPDETGLTWTATVAAPDRFRLLATLTRWSGVIDTLQLGDVE